jgi:RimJ/RimL family protein N-acetyltransferase
MIFASPRLIARRFEPRDLPAFVAMRNDPDVARFQSWENYSEADGQRFIAELAGVEPGSAGWFQFALEDKATGAFAGDCGLDVSATDPQLARIGYTIVSAQWNRGLATEAVIALARYAFTHFPLRRIEASLDPLNAPSRRVLEKAGFRQDGLFQHSSWFEGLWGDDVVYALSREG